jgi:hypothetical protein
MTGDAGCSAQDRRPGRAVARTVPLPYRAEMPAQHSESRRQRINSVKSDRPSRRLFIDSKAPKRLTNWLAAPTI